MERLAAERGHRKDRGGRPAAGPLPFLLVLLALPLLAGAAYRAIPDDVKRGMDLVFERRYGEAVETLLAAAARHPQSPEAHFYLGLAQYSSEMPEEAIGEWEKTLQLAPRFPRVRLHLAMACLDAGDLPGAERNARLAVGEEPGNPAAHLALGRALRQQEKGEEALHSFQRARELAPRDATVRAEAGELLQDLGKEEEAKAEYRKAVELEPENHFFRLLLGLSLFQGEELAGAEREFGEAVRLDPEDPAGYYNLGLVYLRKRSEAGVLAMADVLKTRNPAWAEELLNAWTLQGGGRSAAATTEETAFRVLLAPRFAFTSEYTRRGRYSFLFLESNQEEKHEYLRSQTVRWEVAGGDRQKGYTVRGTQEQSLSTVDGEPSPDADLEDLGKGSFTLQLDGWGRFLSASREGGEPLTPGAVRTLRLLWGNSLLSAAPPRLVAGAAWAGARESYIPLVGWRNLPSRVSVEGFETIGGVRCARIALSLLPGLDGLPPEEAAAWQGKGTEEGPAGDFRGEGSLVLNPQGGWMSSARLLTTGSVVVEWKGRNSQVRFSLQESQVNR